MQSFAPLFLILLIKYFDLKLFHLCKKFSDIVLNNPIYALTKVVNHSAFVTLILELFCLLWIIYSIYSVRKFEKSQRANFVSEGESLIDIEKISDSGVTFFMTYVLPMAMDDLDTWKGTYCIWNFNGNAICANVENEFVLPKSSVNRVGI